MPAKFVLPEGEVKWLDRTCYLSFSTYFPRFFFIKCIHSHRVFLFGKIKNGNNHLLLNLFQMKAIIQKLTE